MNNLELEQFYEKITMVAVTDTIEKLLRYPFGFHGDTGIRDYLYAQLLIRGGEALYFNDPEERPGFSTYLLQSEQYTSVKYCNTGKSGNEARFDLALTLPPKSPDAIEERYAEKLEPLIAFELGKNKSLKFVVDREMSSHSADMVTGTSDISKLYRDLKYQSLRQGWAIEFYDSRKIRGASIIEETLSICDKLDDIEANKKLVVIFVEFTRDGGRHHVSSNNPDIQELLLERLAACGINAHSEVSRSKRQKPSIRAKQSPGSPKQDELFVKGKHIIKYEGKICHLSCKGYSFAIRQFKDSGFVEIDRGSNDRKKYLGLKNKIQVLEKAPHKLTDVSLWSGYFQSRVGEKR